MTEKRKDIKRYNDGLETLRLEGKTLYLDDVEVKNIIEFNMEVKNSELAVITITKPVRLEE